MKRIKKTISGCIKYLVIYLIGTLISYHTPPFLLLLSAESRECYQLISQTMSDYRSYGLNISTSGMRFDKENNRMWYFLRTNKFPACLFGNEITPEIINKMRLQMNQYLKEHPDYFLNKGHEINISLDLADKQGNILISNSSDLNESDQPEHNSGLDYLSLIVANDFMSVSDILTLQGLKGVRLSELYTFPDILKLMRDGNLDYIWLETIYYQDNGDHQHPGKRIDNSEKILREVNKNEEYFQDYRVVKHKGEVVFIKKKI